MTLGRVPPQSRYSPGTGGVLTNVINAGGYYNLTLWRKLPASPNVPFNLYIWKLGDRPDTVANTLLGSPTLWWSIFDLNPEIIYPFNIPPGSVIRVPMGPVNSQSTVYQ